VNKNVRGLLLGAFTASVVAALLDAFGAAGVPYGKLWNLAYAVPALSLLCVLRLFAGTFVLVVLVVFSILWANSHGPLGKLAPALPWVGSAIAIGSAYEHLAAYDAFATYPPALAGFAGLFCAVAIACSGRLGRAEPERSRFAETLAVAVPVLATLGCVGAHVALSRLHVDDYPTLRLSLAQLAHLLLVIALWHGARRLPPRLEARLASPRPPIAVVSALVVGSIFGAFDVGRPSFLARTTLGGSLASLSPYSVEDEQPKQPIADDRDGVATFLRYAHMPKLPEDFDLTQYNVLLIMSEATRFDQTSLASTKRATTPKLQAFQRSGASLYTRAFAPSSGTFLSLSSIFGLGYPSMLKLETWQKPWTGELREPMGGPVTLFKQAGYETFWVSHNNAQCFKQTVLGLGAGFDARTLVETTDTTDAAIADAAITTLTRQSKSKKPFFGFLFFVSPHSPYDVHYPSMRSRRALDRYRQEVRFTDKQVGRVLKSLDRLELREKTIVIYASDHGEEFRDHGGAYHKTTVYTESLHVPLLIRVPGITGSVIDEPTSVAYVLPWLMLHGPAAMRERAAQRMRERFGPMMLATHGAVVAEVLGHDRMKSTLIYRDLKANYDFRAERTEVFRFDTDRREQDDLYLQDSKLADDAQRRITAYRAVRASHRRFTLRPDKLDPRVPRAEGK
jgi:arylsulfatase A-like enzyme